MKAVSLFSNCGAGDVGYATAGFRFYVISEIIQRRLDVASLNHPDAISIGGDLRQSWPEVVDAFRASHGLQAPVLLCGCPPCLGMSTAQSDRGLEADADAGTRDGRNLLALPIAHVAKELAPTFIVVENVPAFLRRKVYDPSRKDPVSAATLLTRRLKNNYHLYTLVINLSKYGVPQSRNRAFLTFVRKDSSAAEVLIQTKKAPFPRPTHGAPELPDEITLDHALGELNLPALDAQSLESARTPEYPMHQVPLICAERYDMVAAIPPRSGASAWESNVCPSCGSVDAEQDTPLCPQCSSPLLRPVIREEDGTWRMIRGFRNSSYRRMSPDEPASTITTASGHIGSDRTLHPWENRVLSPAECAHLQTFPSDFKWGNAIDRWGHSPVRQMIGEAVPPLFTQMHGDILASLYHEKDSSMAMDSDDPHCLPPIQ